MQIEISQAIEKFYPQSSLEMVYFEAIANSLDAGATKISCKISLQSFNDPSTLRITIDDNGDGFSEEGFDRFCKLLSSTNPINKGLGRLVFMKYFKDSIYNTKNHKNEEKSFILNAGFNGNYASTSNRVLPGTTIDLKGYNLDKIKSYDYIRVKSISESIELHFLPQLYAAKSEGKEIQIFIELKLDEENHSQSFISDKQLISTNSIPSLTSISVEASQLDMFEDFTLMYRIEEDYDNQNLVMAIIAENRTIPLDGIIAHKNIPQGYNCIFVLKSTFFEGKVNHSRSSLDLDKTKLNILKNILVSEVNKIFELKIPYVADNNKKAILSLNNRFPHLTGYFDPNTAGLIDRSETLQKAQSDFFNDQKRILDADSIGDALFEKSIEHSSRVLTEYILYRNIIIDRLKSVDNTVSEKSIHDIIAPSRESFSDQSSFDDVYRNNAWLLDDKFMSYKTLLSDKSFKDLVSELSIPEESPWADLSRPDIAILLNGDINTNPVDVVIVELKKKGLTLHEKQKVVKQLELRATNLLKLKSKKIQRIFFYAIVDIDDNFELSLLSDDFTELYSTDKAFYSTKKIVYQKEPMLSSYVGLTILSFEAFLNDAEKRNSVFLELLKSSLKEYSSNK